MWRHLVTKRLFACFKRFEGLSFEKSTWILSFLNGSTDIPSPVNGFLNPSFELVCDFPSFHHLCDRINTTQGTSFVVIFEKKKVQWMNNVQQRFNQQPINVCSSHSTCDNHPIIINRIKIAFQRMWTSTPVRFGRNWNGIFLHKSQFVNVNSFNLMINKKIR